MKSAESAVVSPNPQARAQLVARLEKYLLERDRARGLDPVLIHGLNAGDDEREAELAVADVREAVAWLKSDEARGV